YKHLRSQQDTSTILRKLADEHLGSCNPTLNHKEFELFYLKMLQSLKPPLLVAGHIDASSTTNDEQEEYRRRLQTCRLDPGRLRAQAGKHFSIFGKGNDRVGISEVRQSIKQMWSRVMPNSDQVPGELDRQVVELLTSHADGRHSRFDKDSWELFYWKMLSTTFHHLLPLEIPGCADSPDSTKEFAEESMSGAFGDQATDPSPTTKLGCGGTAASQALQGAAGLVPPSRRA
ncbi:unnamed protein product, partial [Prorocentrum cordatum]